MSERRSHDGMARRFVRRASEFVRAVVFEFGESTRVWAADQHIEDLNGKLFDMELMGDESENERVRLTTALAEARSARALLTEAALQRQGRSREN